MSLLRGVLRGSQQVRRLNSSTVPAGYKNLEPVKSRFNTEDGLPVFVKGGSLDKILYGATVITCVAAIGFNIKLYYDLSLK